MGDKQMDVSSFIIGVGLIFLSGEYIYVLLGPEHFKSEIVAKAINIFFDYRVAARLIFFVFSILAWIIFGYSEKLDKFNKKNKNYKYIALVIFIASIPAIYFADLIPRNIYLITYPLAILLFLFHGYVLSNLLSSAPVVEDDFAFQYAKTIEENAYSINWYSEDEDAWLNIVSPFRHIFCTGSPGAGKSYTIVKPILRTLVKKGYTGIVYDWKAPELIKVIVDAFMHHANRIPTKEELKNYPLWLNKITAGNLLSSEIMEPIGGRSDVEVFTNKVRKTGIYKALNELTSHGFEDKLLNFENHYRNEDFKGNNIKIGLLFLFPGNTKKVLNKEKEFYKNQKKKIVIKQEKSEQEKRAEYEKKANQSLLKLIGIKRPSYDRYLQIEADKKEKERQHEDLYPKKAKEAREKRQKEIEKKKAKNYTENRKLWLINFSEPHKSHRVNPIAPEYLLTPTHAQERASSFVKNLAVADGESKADPFFESNAIAYLQCIIWFLKEERPEKCTLPYAISIALIPYPQVISMLLGNDTCANIIASIKTADDTNAEGQLAGVVSSLQTPIAKLYSPEIFYIFSGNDFSLRLNSWETPGLLVITNNDELASVYSPIAALIISSAAKLMNQSGRRHSAINIDESPTLKIPRLSNILGTCRSNMISFQLFAQTYSQWIQTYGDKEAKTVLGTTGNQLYGNCGVDDDAKLAMSVVGKRDKSKTSTNKNKSKGQSSSKSQGENTSTERRDLIEISTMHNLEQGRFIGKVCDVREGDPTVFNLKLQINEPEELYEYSKSITKHPMPSMDNQWIDMEDMQERMLTNSKFIRDDATEIVDIGCRLAIIKGISGDLNPQERERRIFTDHFNAEGIRVKDIMGRPLDFKEMMV